MRETGCREASRGLLSALGGVGCCSCHLKRLDEDDEVVDISADRFFTIVGEGTPTADAAAIAQDAVHSIDVLHPERAALATVQIVLPPKRYTDILSLLKLDGQWMIINKVPLASRRSAYWVHHGNRILGPRGMDGLKMLSSSDSKRVLICGFAVTSLYAPCSNP